MNMNTSPVGARPVSINSQESRPPPRKYNWVKETRKFSWVIGAIGLLGVILFIGVPMYCGFAEVVC